MPLSNLVRQDWKSNKLTTAQRLYLGSNLTQRNKYLQVYDIELDKRFAWDGVAWIETESIPSNNVAVVVTYVAQVNISAFSVVTSEGKVGDSSITSQRSKIIGIANVSVLTGFVGTAIGEGIIVNSGWSWVIGDVIYLNGTTLSTIAPSTGYIQRIGTATAPDTIDVILSPSILL